MELSERGENGASTAKGASGGGASRSTSRKPDPTADSRRGVRPAGAAAAGKLGDGSDDEGHYLLSRFTRGADAYADTCFSYSLFWRWACYHLFYPFSLPVMLWVEGYSMVYHTLLLPSPRFLSAFVSQTGPHLVFGVYVVLRRWTTVLQYVGTSAWDLWAIAHVLRVVFIAIKYAVMSKVDYQRIASDTMSQGTRLRHTLLGYWAFPTVGMITSQLVGGAMRQLDTLMSEETVFVLEPDAVHQLADAVSKRDFDEKVEAEVDTRGHLLYKWGDRTVPVFGVAAAIYAKTANDVRPNSFALWGTRVIILLNAVLCLQQLDYENKDGTLPQHIILWIVGVFLLYSEVRPVLLFSAMAVLDTKRRLGALKLVDSLIRQRERIAGREETTPGSGTAAGMDIAPPIVEFRRPLVPILSAQNVVAWVSLRRLVLNMAGNIKARLEYVVGTSAAFVAVLSVGFTFAGILFGSAELSVTAVGGAEMLQPLYVWMTFHLIMLLQMVTAGAAANSQSATAQQALREAELAVNEFLARRQGAADGPSWGVPGNAELRRRRGTVVADAATEAGLSCMGSRIPSMTGLAPLYDCAARLLEWDVDNNPITVFGIRASYKILTAVGTVAAAAGTTVLRTVLPKFIAQARAIAEAAGKAR